MNKEDNTMNEANIKQLRNKKANELIKKIQNVCTNNDIKPLVKFLEENNDFVDLEINKIIFGTNKLPILSLLVTSGNVTAVKMLIDKGFHPNINCVHHNHPLIIAISFGYTKIVDLLTNYIDVNDPQLDALMYAIVQQKNNIVELLIKKGANVNKIGFNGLTPLQMTLTIFNTDIQRILLCNGAGGECHKDWSQMMLLYCLDQISASGITEANELLREYL